MSARRWPQAPGKVPCDQSLNARRQRRPVAGPGGPENADTGDRLAGPPLVAVLAHGRDVPGVGVGGPAVDRAGKGQGNRSHPGDIFLKNGSGREYGFCGTTVGMEAAVTEEIIARQPPQSQAIIRRLLARIAELEAERTGPSATPRAVRFSCPRSQCAWVQSTHPTTSSDNQRPTAGSYQRLRLFCRPVSASSGRAVKRNKESTAGLLSDVILPKAS